MYWKINAMSSLYKVQMLCMALRFAMANESTTCCKMSQIRQAEARSVAGAKASMEFKVGDPKKKRSCRCVYGMSCKQCWPYICRIHMSNGAAFISCVRHVSKRQLHTNDKKCIRQAFDSRIVKSYERSTFLKNCDAKSDLEHKKFIRQASNIAFSKRTRF